MNEICLKKVQNHLLKIRKNLDPETIISAGMKRSLLESDGKKKWR